jgi:hypothetical protein
MRAQGFTMPLTDTVDDPDEMALDTRSARTVGTGK